MFITIIGLLIISMSLIGCTGDKSDQIMSAQNESKKIQAAAMMEQTPTPAFDRSLERENISNRLKSTNDPTQLTWIYPMSAGRVIGRFPVRGKVTSGGKRLTSTQQVINGLNTFALGEAPDEMGAYGSSGDYIFWFDPAGRGPLQHKGDYFISPIPYKIDSGYGTISYEVDQIEEAKRNIYEKETKANPIIKGGK
jgi:hypothetical protein